MKLNCFDTGGMEKKLTEDALHLEFFYGAEQIRDNPDILRRTIILLTQ
jgi:hypothetical protein